MVMSQESTRHAGRLSGCRPGFALIELLVARVRSRTCRAVWVIPSLSSYGGSQSSRTARASESLCCSLCPLDADEVHRLLVQEGEERGGADFLAGDPSGVFSCLGTKCRRVEDSL